MCLFSRYPIGFGDEQFFRFSWIIGEQVDAELMLPIHASVHHIVKHERGFCARFESRRTDDSFRRSATFYDFDLRFAEDLQRLISHILQTKGSSDRLA